MFIFKQSLLEKENPCHNIFLSLFLPPAVCECFKCCLQPHSPAAAAVTQGTKSPNQIISWPYSVLAGNTRGAFPKDLEVNSFSVALFYYAKLYLSVFDFWPWSTWLVHQRTWQEGCSPAPERWRGASSGLLRDSQSWCWHTPANQGLSGFPSPGGSRTFHSVRTGKTSSPSTDFHWGYKPAHNFITHTLKTFLHLMKHLLDSVLTVYHLLFWPKFCLLLLHGLTQ